MTVEPRPDPFRWMPPDSWDRVTTLDAHTLLIDPSDPLRYGFLVR